jgi:outer membrane protein TolC/anti-anti-sigma regulatory factor
MLKITTIREERLTTLELEGKLAGAWVKELEKCWGEELRASPGTPIQICLRAVSFIDSAGKELLAEMHRQGAELVALGCMTRAIIAEITSGSRDSARQPAFPWFLRKTFTVFLLAVALIASRELRAQERPPIHLTLRDAVQLALKQNPEVQIANLEVARSLEDRALAAANLLPQVGLQVSDAVRRANLEAAIGRRFPFAPQHVGPYQIFQAGPGFSMPIFDLTLWRRWQASQQGIRVSQARELGVREQTVLLVVSQYLASQRAQADVQAAQSRVALAQALYQLAADQQKSGVGIGIDTVRANVQLQNEKQRLIEAQTGLETSLYGLVRLLSLDPHQKVELTDGVSFFQTPEFSADQSLEQAYANRPEMKALRSQELAQLAEKKTASESRLPKLGVAGSWAYQGLSSPSAIPSYNYEIDVSVPLFTGGRIRAEMTRANLELKRIGQQQLDLRNQIAQEVKTALAQLEAARHEVQVASQGFTLAEQEVAQARDRFKAGVTNNIEVISAQDELARANDNQITALYRYNQARADLARATGQTELLYAK